MKDRFLFFFTLVILASSLTAQDFLDGAFTFSSKKESYITLADGKELTGFIDDIDRKKGLIEEITIIDLNKKKIKLKPEEVKHMYIVPSGFDKLSSGMNNMYDATKWNEDKSAHAEHIKAGYVFFETTEVMVKKKKLTLLLQLLNPGFANKIKVFFDPYAGETASFGFGGIKLAGGDAKSYYFKKGDNVAYKMEKKNYDDELENLYGDCPSFKKEFEKKMGWSMVEKHIFYYSGKCE
ncbi:MAG: hypothetical protein KA270_12495 [Saprospiraceae bacterium]|jgi:hypothetical protein|nr:hypothetical protein [Saprospiraceae bacterium]MBP6235245.1 hypothetical protein [Saprospiraceae bacterium]MBP6567981.1 hypothetical protein [Saprospiraceae bacterium]